MERIKISTLYFIIVILHSVSAAESLPRIVWQKFHNHGFDDQGYSIAVEKLPQGTGNIYVAGTSYNGRNNDCFLLKYNSSGDTVWTRTYDGGDNDYARDIAVDFSGNIYLAGTSYNKNNDCLILKYNNKGNLLWQRTYDAGYNYPESGEGIDIDPEGNIYVAGTSFNGKNRDYLVMKYTQDGDTIWIRTYDSGNDDYTKDIKTDKEGNVYVTGYSWLNNIDYLTLKYNPRGELIWAKRYDSKGIDEAKGIAVYQDSIYVAGSSSGECFTIKYDSRGNVLWTRRYNSGYGDSPEDITVDSKGNIYITGASSNMKDSDCLVVKYTPEGNVVWAQKWDNGSWERGCGIAISEEGSIFITGYAWRENMDCFVIKYR